MTVESNRTGVLRAGPAVNPRVVLATKPRNHELRGPVRLVGHFGLGSVFRHLKKSILGLGSGSGFQNIPKNRILVQTWVVSVKKSAELYIKNCKKLRNFTSSNPLLKLQNSWFP
jgi:hypothetical protein